MGQAVNLLLGMLHGILAGAELREWTPGPEPALSEDARTHLAACVRAYHDAWPLGGAAPSGSIPAASAAETTDRCAIALNLLAADAAVFTDGKLDESTWLAVRRLLAYLLNKPEQPANQRDIETRILLYDRGTERGVVGPLKIRSGAEGRFACYLDPVALGQTCVDQEMLESLRLAWRACQPQLVTRFNTLGEPLPAIRLSPNLGEVTEINGGSAGGLFACGIFAAATGAALNSDATASVALKLDGSESGGYATNFGIGAIRLEAVAEEAIQAKLEAAGSHKLRHVVLTSNQATLAGDKNLIPSGVVVHGAEMLTDVYRHLIGDARIERVLEAYCKARVDEWERTSAGGEIRDDDPTSDEAG